MRYEYLKVVIEKMESKKCSKCGSTKPVSMFCKNRTRPDGLDCQCKVCKQEYDKEYYASHRKERIEQQKEYDASHKKQIQKYKKEYYALHRDEMLEQQKEYNAAPKGKMVRAIIHAKRRNLGFKLLYPLPMEYFRHPQNYCFHHVTDKLVVCIPHRLHKIDRSKKHREALEPFVKIFYFDHIMESRGGR